MLMFLIFLGLFVCCTNSAPQIYENQDASLDRSKWNENRFNRAIEIERNMRIVGGSVASATQFQHSVALFLKLHQGDSFCGGSIIHPNYVLTAAHCLDDLIQIEMLAGTTTIFNGRPGYREIIPASDTRQHHNYDRNTLRNDIGIICARTRIPFNDRIRAIRLPSANLNLNTVRNSANRPSLIGWGRTSDASQNLSNTLQFVQLPILPEQNCVNVYSHYFVPSLNICISASSGSTCNGDSGGSATLPIGGIDTIIGIVSFGSSLCESGHPIALVRVSAYIDWINSILQPRIG